MSKLEVADSLRLSLMCWRLRRILLFHVCAVLQNEFWLWDVNMKLPSECIMGTWAALNNHCELHVLEDGYWQERIERSWFSHKNGLYRCVEGGESEQDIVFQEDSFFHGFAWAPDHEKSEFQFRLLAVADRFRSGKKIVFDAKLKSSLQSLLPRGRYFLTRDRGVFEPDNEPEELREVILNRTKEVFPNYSPFDLAQMDLDGHQVQLLTQVASNMGGGKRFFCSTLCLSVVTTQQHLNRSVVDRYKAQMEEDANFAPTLLLLAPNFDCCMGRGLMMFFSRAALLLDGHHKLTAAAELGRELQVVFVDRDRPLIFHKEAFPFRERKNGNV
jgi:hypothetical protein